MVGGTAGHSSLTHNMYFHNSFAVLNIQQVSLDQGVAPQGRQPTLGTKRRTLAYINAKQIYWI